MASIPPAWLASNILGVGSQQRAAEARDRDAADAAKKAGGESPFSRELTEAIETGDRDEQVDADGQGGGGQGRAPADSPDQQPVRDDDESDDPETHIDLKA